MPHSDDLETLPIKRICFRCIGEAYLSDEIEQTGQIAPCSYCDQTAESYSIEELAERIETVFDHHYYLTSSQPNSWQQSLRGVGKPRADPTFEIALPSYGFVDVELPKLRLTSPDRTQFR